MEYDDNYLVDIIRYLDESGNPTEMSGIAKTVMAYDSVGNVIERSFWDSQDEPCSNQMGIHRYSYGYGDHSLLLSVSAWSTAGEPCLFPSGHHEERYSYDERGSRVAVELLDPQDNPI
jgi:hypothetical protein